MRRAAAGLGRRSQSQSYTVTTDERDPENTVVVTVAQPGKHSRRIRIHREDADPEHRFTAYRLAAGWFGNLPARYAME